MRTLFPCFALVLLNVSVRGWEYRDHGKAWWWTKENSDGVFNFETLQEYCDNDWYLDHSCLPDGTGYLDCAKNKETHVSLRGRKFRHNRRVYIKKCDPGYHCGKCHVDVYDQGRCRCVDSAKPPNFPKTGRITWTGKVSTGSFGSPYDNPFNGFMQTTHNGRYLFKTFSTFDYWQGWERKTRSAVTIIVPNNDGIFTEYKGDGKGSCTKTTTQKDNRKQLSWLWPHFTKDGRDIYELIETKGDVQKWKVYHDMADEAMGGVDYDRWWTMTVKKLKIEGNIGIPVKFYMRDSEWDDGLWYTRADFKYQPIESFKISDYCDGVE